MRALHTFAREAEARTLADAMYGEGIEATVSATRDGSFLLWVHDDEKLDDARSLLEAFRADPNDRRLADALARSRSKRKDQAKRERAASRRVAAARTELERGSGVGTVTLFLVLSIVGVQVLAYGGHAESLARILAFADVDRPYHTGFEWIARGQVWRLVTPIALSGGFLAAFFDALWIFYLAGAFERTHRSRWVTLFVIAAAAITNSVEVALFRDVHVAGMTGLYHAFFAYLFVRERTDPRFPQVVPGSFGLFIMVFDILALAGFIHPSEIGARLSGLAFGAAVGALGTALGKRR